MSRNKVNYAKFFVYIILLFTIVNIINLLSFLLVLLITNVAVSLSSFTFRFLPLEAISTAYHVTTANKSTYVYFCIVFTLV